MHFGEYLGLYIDKSNRLWADDYGYLIIFILKTLSGIKLSVHRFLFTIDFLTMDNINGAMQAPIMKLRMVYCGFIHRQGLANLDLKTKKWCLESTIV